MQSIPSANASASTKYRYLPWKTELVHPCCHTPVQQLWCPAVARLSWQQSVGTWADVEAADQFQLPIRSNPFGGVVAILSGTMVFKWIRRFKIQFLNPKLTPTPQIFLHSETDISRIGEYQFYRRKRSQDYNPISSSSIRQQIWLWF